MNIDRVNSELRKEIADIIANTLKDPRLDSAGMISVMRVEATRDLKYAKVFVSLMDDPEPQTTLLALKSGAGFIRGELFNRVKIRTVPNLTFALDSSLEYGLKIDKILRGLDIKPEPDTEGEN